MNYFRDINIGNIKVIVKKGEKENFKFSTCSREGAGFVCFLSGEGSFHIEENVYPVRAGTFIRFERGDSYRFDVKAPCSYITSNMDIEIIGTDALPRLIECTAEEVNGMLRVCRAWEEQGEYCYIEMRILLLQFFIGVMRRVAGEREKMRSSVSAALSYVHKNYNKNFSIEDISVSCNVSSSHLRQCFKKSVGCSIMQYRDELRITHAKAMITSGEFTLKEISELLGYYDIYHFSKKFKASTGIAPGRYKNMER